MSETNGSDKKYAGRDDFRKLVGQRVYDEVPHPQLGTVRIQNLTDGEARALGAKAFNEKGESHDLQYLFADRLIAQAIDADGDALFGEMDREWLTQIPYSASKSLNKAMVAIAEEEYQSPDEIKKKSEEIQIST